MNEQTLEVLTWLIPAAPLAAFFLIVLFTKHNRTLSWLLAWAGVISATVMGWTVAFQLFAENVHHLAEHPVVVASAVDWLPTGIEQFLQMGVSVDPLTAVMLFAVPFIITMIFIYSVGYHNYGKPRGTVRGVPNHGQEDPLISRFFALMSLFAGGMLTLVVADNILLLFVGWEIMGFCSYALISFWYARNYDDPKKITPRQAGIKAFLTTRVADVVMLVGIVYFYRVFGTMNFSEALSAHGLETAVHLVGAGTLGVIALLLFTGTVGKSAQWPLHVWLPDAMEGPTPVSAVIHAAAMVSAGVYMIIRIFPLIAVGMDGNPNVGYIIGGIGAFTALMAATIAIAQNDVKGVLAYSTISQLGYMVAAIGIGAYVAAAFHLITHAFFKALLFLGSGSIIHGMEHGAGHVHDHHTDPQNMLNMGGLAKKMPKTFWTFVIGGFALSGFPIVTAGFWSKDEILADAFHQSANGDVFAGIVFWTLAIAAALTAFYTMRQISLTFLGKPRTPLAEHAHESDNFMTIPLLLLSVFAVGIGWFGIPEEFPVLGGLVNNNFFHHFVGATIEETLHELGMGLETLPFNWFPLIVSFIVALGGLYVGWLVYGRKPLKSEQPDPLIRPLGPLHTFLKNKWYWDELYQAVFINPTIYISEVIVYEWMDKGAIDGTIHLVARTVYRIGAYMKWFEQTVISGGVDWLKDQFLAMTREARELQTGKIQEYTLVSMLIASALALVILGINFGWFAQFIN